MNDFTKICRTCALQGELISLFVEQPFRIADMLANIVSLKVKHCFFVRITHIRTPTYLINISICRG